MWDCDINKFGKKFPTVIIPTIRRSCVVIDCVGWSNVTLEFIVERCRCDTILDALSGMTGTTMNARATRAPW
jgi:uncharacterized membrane protein